MFVNRWSPTGDPQGLAVNRQPSDQGVPSLSRDAIEAASRLYNQVDEEVHRLVLTSNRCLQELEGLQELKVLQEGGDRVSVRGGDQSGLRGEVTRSVSREVTSQDSRGSRIR